MQIVTVDGPLCKPLAEAMLWRDDDPILKLETDDLEKELKSKGIEIFQRYDNILITEIGYQIVVPYEWIEEFSICEEVS